MTRKRDRIFILVIVAAFLLTTVGVSVALIWQIVGESKQDKTSQQQADAANNPANKLKGTNMQDFTPVAKIEKLEIIDLTPGTGDTVKTGDNLTVDYTGAVAATGKVFESSLDSGQPVPLGLNDVIVGWQEGLVGMKVGGKRRLLIPADKAYGADSPSPDIPANADLVFDITLHAIQKK